MSINMADPSADATAPADGSGQFDVCRNAAEHGPYSRASLQRRWPYALPKAYMAVQA